MSTIEPMLAAETHPGHEFAMELDKHLKIQFDFLFNEDSPEFQPIYYACCYLSPFHRVFIKDDKMTVIKQYLRGNNKLLFGKLIN